MICLFFVIFSLSFFSVHRDNVSGGADECSGGGGGELLQPAVTDDVCPWDVQADGSAAAAGDKKRSLPVSIAEERERRLSSTSSSRKNSGSGGGNATAYDSAASADESQSDSVASRLRRSCGLGGDSNNNNRRRRGSSSSNACTPQQTVDRPSVSSAEDFDIGGPSPESRSPEKLPPRPTSPAPHEQVAIATAQQQQQDAAAKSNRKTLLKSLSLSRKQSITPVINVSSVDRDNNGCKTAANVADDAYSVAVTAAAECSAAGNATTAGTDRTSADTATPSEGATAVADSDGNDVCPWEDE